MSHLSNAELQPYAAKVQQAEADYAAILRRDNASVDGTIQLAATMNMLRQGIQDGGLLIPLTAQRSSHLSEVASFYYGKMLPDDWFTWVEGQVQMRLFLEDQPIFKDLHREKLTEYKKLGKSIKYDPNLIMKSTPGIIQVGSFNWFPLRSARLNKLLEYFTDDLEDWSRSQLVTKEFLAASAESQLNQYMQDRPFPGYMLRISQRLPWDKDIQPVKRDGTLAPDDLEADIPLLPEDQVEVDLDSPQDVTKILKSHVQDELDWEMSERMKAELNDVIHTMDEKVSTGETIVTVLEIVVDICLALEPIIGPAVDIYEIAAKKDIWGRQMSDFERALAVVFFLLQFNRVRSVLLKGARFIKPQFVVGAAAGAATLLWQSEAEGSARLDRALDFLRKVDSQLARDLEKALSRASSKLSKEAEATLKAAARRQISRGLTLKPEQRKRIANLMVHVATGTPHTLKRVPKLIEKEWAALLQKPGNGLLKYLDAAAFERAVQKFYPDHIKGQILEEFGAGFINAILRSRRKNFLFNVEKLLREGWVLKFYPGHLIRDRAGRQLTDGLLVLVNPAKTIVTKIGKKDVQVPVLKVLAVFEFKAGMEGARELLIGAATKIADLPKVRQKALVVMARIRQQEARLAGESLRKSLKAWQEDIFKEQKRFGQIVTDYERMKAANTIIKIDGDFVNISLSKTETQFWGMVPKDLPAEFLTKMEQELQSIGFEAYVKALPISYQTLEDMARDTSELAHLIWAMIK